MLDMFTLPAGYHSGKSCGEKLTLFTALDDMITDTEESR